LNELFLVVRVGTRACHISLEFKQIGTYLQAALADISIGKTDPYI
jgi:hypothetical protein